MNTVQEVRAAALVTGHTLKRKNAITAVLCGVVPGLIAGAFLHPSLSLWIAGIVFGLLWSNAFEYAYHRWLLHLPNTSFGKAHTMHHISTGKPNEPEHITFGSSPVWLALLFAANGIPALIVGWRLGVPLAPGILVGFALYLIAVEEIHWRVHLGGWLPWGRWVREYHLAHHDIPTGRYNVFFPVFDYLMGNVQPPLEQTEAAIMARNVRAPSVEFHWIPVSMLRAGLWFWVVGVTIGVRYLWTAKARV